MHRLTGLGVGPSLAASLTTRHRGGFDQPSPLRGRKPSDHQTHVLRVAKDRRPPPDESIVGDRDPDRHTGRDTEDRGTDDHPGGCTENSRRHGTCQTQHDAAQRQATDMVFAETKAEYPADRRAIAQRIKNSLAKCPIHETRMEHQE